jgi:hypothetical protein
VVEKIISKMFFLTQKSARCSAVKNSLTDMNSYRENEKPLGNFAAAISSSQISFQKRKEEPFLIWHAVIHLNTGVSLNTSLHPNDPHRHIACGTFPR